MLIWKITSQVDFKSLEHFPSDYVGEFILGDGRAHEWSVNVKHADLEGCNAMAYVLRADGNTVPVNATITNNVVSAVLHEHCYAVEGFCSAIMRLTDADGRTITLAAIKYRINRKISESYVDTGDVIPNIDELLAQVARIEDAVNNANQLPYIGENGNWYIWSIEESSYVDSGNPSKGNGSGDGATGADGGYYKPVVDENGNISWIASRADMPEVSESNIKGPQGEPGFSPTVTVTRKGSLVEVKATNANGQTSAASVSDGTAGKDGVGIREIGESPIMTEDGEIGKEISVVLTDGSRYSFSVMHGENGADGTTPVKGTDYFTDTDKAEMVAAVQAAVAADSAWVTGYGIPILYLTGDTAGMTKEVAVNLNWAYGDKSGTCTLKWQGASSIAYDKKNFTIKLGSAIDVGWGEQKKYCLKANFIDHSHARNVVSAKLWGTLVASRKNIHPTMAAAPNYGAVDGFPCAIVLNGVFQGLYTWNIPKDDWMANMGAGTKEAILCASNSTDATAFKALPTYVGTSDLEIEYVTDETDTEWLKTSANRLISLVMASTGYDLDTTIAQYLDWESAIDYYLFTAFHAGKDNVTKNYLLLTYDGTKWYFGAYDMDGTYGIKWNGKEFERANSTTSMTLDGMASAHRVFELIKRFKTDALKARWAELRKNFLSEGKICRTFENFVKDIPSRLYFEDACRWPSIPSTSVSNVDQILRWVHQRLEYMDEMIANLPAQETPVEPEPAMVNQVPLSTDTDGSIYNGVGYKDDTRLSSSGGVSGTPQTGSVTTGFIPYAVYDVLRVKGGICLNIPVDGHYYLGLYDATKTKLACTGHDGMAGADYPQITYTYDEASGITTIVIGEREGHEGDWEAGIAYIRMNVYGKGEDLIVTVNQEIT